MTRNTSPKPLFQMAGGTVPDIGEGRGDAITQPSQANPLELLNRKQVAAEYGLSVKTLERYAWAGGGPPLVKLGHRTVRYRRGDIEAFITAHVVGDAG